MVRRILIVLAAGDAYPSGFIRGLIYRDHFARSGLRVTYVSRLYPPLIRLLDTPPRWLWRLMGAGLGGLISRFAQGLGVIADTVITWRARRYDVVYMSKVTSPRLIRKLRAQTRTRLVLDFGDALWLPGRGGERFNDILRQVDAVTTDNELTAAYVRRLNPRCTVIPDCPQVEWFDRRRVERRPSNVVTIGWVGTPNTVHNLFVVWEALERLCARHLNVRVRLVGVGRDQQGVPPFERVPYSIRSRYTRDQMIDEVLGMDIGLFPLQDVEASRVRGVLKATVYMAGEAVAVCSPVGQNRDLIQDGVNGFLAGDTAEWEEKLERLVTNPELRARVARAALEQVRRDFSVDRSFEKLRGVLLSTNGAAAPVLPV